MTRLDFSEYAESHAIARLVGAPPGYVGHEAGGQLTEAVRKRPYQVLLLDEIEKAHRDVLEAFLQVFDEGRMTDGRGRTVDFTNAVIVMTSNLGADVARPTTRGRIGFGAQAEERDTRAYEEALCAAARAALPPELYNRIDEVLAFAPLGRADVAEVARRMLRALGRGARGRPRRASRRERRRRRRAPGVRRLRRRARRAPDATRDRPAHRGANRRDDPRGRARARRRRPRRRRRRTHRRRLGATVGASARRLELPSPS